jgi:hypothetical protein
MHEGVHFFFLQTKLFLVRDDNTFFENKNWSSKSKKKKRKNYYINPDVLFEEEEHFHPVL